MAPKNGFAAQIESEKQIAFEIGWSIGWQQAMDFVAVALNDPDVMGKGVMGGERIDKVLHYAQQLQGDYKLAFKPKDPEADVWQERLDALQRRIYKDKFQPFEERYPDLRKIRYVKGWSK